MATPPPTTYVSQDWSDGAKGTTERMKRLERGILDLQELLTTLLATLPPAGVVTLTSPTNEAWRLTVDTDGHLVTTKVV